MTPKEFTDAIFFLLVREHKYSIGDANRISKEAYWLDYYSDERGPWTPGEAIQAEIDEGHLKPGSKE